jgi:glucose/arabinose dehydrogenase/cytochrome c5
MPRSTQKRTIRSNLAQGQCGLDAYIVRKRGHPRRATITGEGVDMRRFGFDRTRALRLFQVTLGILLAGAVTPARAATDAKTSAQDDAVSCMGDVGITLPPGFCATVFADHLGHARHMAVAENGAVYVNTWSGVYYGNDKPPPGGFLVALKDTDGDGKADVVSRFGDTVTQGAAGGTGIALYNGALYVEANDRIVRYKLPESGVVPTDPTETIVSGLPLTGDHPMHPFAINAKGELFVDVATATNSCQQANRMPKSPGLQPCTELETRGGIWRYDANKTGQTFSPAERYATGIRNADGIAIDPQDQSLYAAQQGRDELSENWPDLYQPKQGASLPAEELIRVEQGADYGWPECYFDGTQKKLVLAPEYGGDGGKKIGVCADKKPPIAWFPAHWAPNDLLIYAGDGFPAAYRGGAFIAFHGSWNRAPFPQGGYNVVFQPLAGGKPSGTSVIFADGFAGAKKDPGGAAHRPSGVAAGPDGSLYISDDQNGRIWRVTFRGDPKTTGIAPAPSPAAANETTGSIGGDAEPPEGIHPNAGSDTADNLPAPAGQTKAQVALGDEIFHGQDGAACTGCHGTNAKGTPLGPDLTDEHWLWGDGSVPSIAATITNGVPNPKNYRSSMPPMGGAQLTPTDVLALADYVWALNQRKN